MRDLLRKLEEALLQEGADVGVQRTGLTGAATDAQLEKAYRKLVDDARWEHGHGGYSGSIAESGGMQVRRDLVFATANDVYQAVDDFAEKWGPAVAVLVGKKGDPPKKLEFFFAGIYSS